MRSSGQRGSVPGVCNMLSWINGMEAAAGQEEKMKEKQDECNRSPASQVFIVILIGIMCSIYLYEYRVKAGWFRRAEGVCIRDGYRTRANGSRNIEASISLAWRDVGDRELEKYVESDHAWLLVVILTAVECNTEKKEHLDLWAESKDRRS